MADRISNIRLNITKTGKGGKRNKRIPRSFWGKADCFPPILVRLLARENHGGHPRPISHLDLSIRSGLSLMAVAMLSESLSWDDVGYGSMRRFLLACGVDFCNNAQMRQHTMYLQRPRFSHLRRSQEWKTVFQPLMQKWFQYASRT